MTMRRNRVHRESDLGRPRPRKGFANHGRPDQMSNRRGHLAPQREVSALDSLKSVAEAPGVKR